MRRGAYLFAPLFKGNLYNAKGVPCLCKGGFKMVKVNAVGMACPLPVIETRKALRTEDVVETTVDNKIATENLRKMAAELGYT